MIDWESGMKRVTGGTINLDIFDSNCKSDSKPDPKKFGNPTWLLSTRPIPAVNQKILKPVKMMLYRY